MSVVEIVSSDDVKFTVPVVVISQSLTIKNMLSDIGEDGIIPLPSVTSKILAKVIEYCTHRSNIPVAMDEQESKNGDKAPKADEKPSEGVELTEWDKKYLDIPNDMLFELILAANYLDIKNLLEISCKYVALLIKGKKAPEIRKIFGIVNDFTPEEEEQIRKENEWCEEK